MEALRPDSTVGQRIRRVERGQSHKIDLGGGVFVMEQAYDTKARSEGFFESHRSYIDVQVIIEGEEILELIDAARIKPKQDYIPERDLVLYEDSGDASALRAFVGDTAIFYPADVHMPGLRLRSGPTLVRKAVAKVPVA